MTEETLRERKRRRTRARLVQVATDLFRRVGYDETTVADIAAAADIGTRTFFTYFASKEELLFPEGDARVQAAIDAIASRAPDEGPAQVLLRALDGVAAAGGDMTGDLAALRTRLIRTVPAVQGRALRLQLEAQREIAGHLRAAYPDDLDEVSAAALIGAFVGAVSGALQVLLAEPDTDQRELGARLRHATDVALLPWRGGQG